MLNYIWTALIIIGVICAIGNDVADQVQNRYRNGIPVQVVLDLQSPGNGASPNRAAVTVSRRYFAQFYGLPAGQQQADSLRFSAALSADKRLIRISIDDGSPEIWRTMATALGSKDLLTGHITSFTPADSGSGTGSASVMFDRVTLVRMRAVTAAMFEYAGIAVTIAFGLIGLMALWLGIMKIAEAAGMMSSLTRVLAPVMRRLFPEIPPDHPAMGAMIMNIAANMLGLSNAATPFGIKAMEELQKLNTEKETATNPMVTFLAINTGGLTLIPATALAVRAGLGSANPTIIIGTTIVGATIATIVGIITAKSLQRMPFFRTGRKGGADGTV